MDHHRQLGEDAGVRAELRGEHAVDLFLRRDRSITRDRLDRLATPLVDRARDDECVPGGKAKLDLHRGCLGLAADLVGASHAGHVAEDPPRGGHDQRCLPDAVRGHDERGAGPELEIEPVVGAPVLELQTLDHRVPISLLNASSTASGCTRPSWTSSTRSAIPAASFSPNDVKAFRFGFVLRARPPAAT